MATKTFKLDVNGTTVLQLKVSGDAEIVDNFVKEQVQGSFGVLYKLRDEVAAAGQRAIKRAEDKQLKEDEKAAYQKKITKGDK